MIDRIIAGGVAGLGQGITEQAKQRGLMQREQALERMRAASESARATRDRDWQLEDDQRQRGYELEDAETKRTQELEDREDERAYETESADAQLARDRNLAAFEAGLPARPRSGSSSSDPDGTAMTREVEYLAEALARSRGEELSDQHRLEAVQLRRSPSGDTASQDRARNAIFDALVGDRRDRRSIEEKWDEANQMVGLAKNGPASSSGGGLGGGLDGGSSALKVPQPGTIEDGYEFLGGDPSDPNSWRPVE